MTVYRVLATIIHLCDIEFSKVDNSKHDAVYIKNEKKSQKGT